MVIRDTIIHDPTGDLVSQEELEGELLNDTKSFANMQVGEMALVKVDGYRWIHAKLLRRNGLVSSDPDESEVADEMEFEINKTGGTRVIQRASFVEYVVRSKAGQKITDGAASRRNAEKEAEMDARWTVKAWLVSLNVMSVIGAALLDQKPVEEGGQGEDERVKSLTDEDIEYAVDSASVSLKMLLKDELKKLKQQREVSATKLNSKFQAEGNGFTLGFGDMKTFDGGLEAYIGTPSPNVEETMEHEHVRGEWSQEQFGLWNGYKTTAAKEWAYVDSEEGLPEASDKSVNDGRVREKGRNGWKLAGFMIRYGRNAVVVHQPKHELDSKTGELVGEDLELMGGVLEADKEYTLLLHDNGPGAAADDLKKWKQRKSAGLGVRVCVLGRYLVRNDLVFRAGLRLAEVRALRLYTGPMFRWYNDVLRFRTMKAWGGYDGPVLQAGQCWLDIREERKTPHPFVTTLHVLNSAILKVAKIQHVEKVYRGIGGAILPLSFTKPNDMGVRGGIELGFMSTTRKREVAMEYAGASSAGGERPSVVFEVQMGMIDRGAPVQWVSQFPEEEEILFAPLAALEVVGSPSLDGSTIVVPLRVSCNSHDLPIEQLTAKMRKSHMDLVGMIIGQMEQALEQVANKNTYLQVMRTHTDEMYSKMTAEELDAQWEAETIDSFQHLSSGMSSDKVVDKLKKRMSVAKLVSPLREGAAAAEPPAPPRLNLFNRGKWFNKAEHFMVATKLALERKYEACWMLMKDTADFRELSEKGRRMVLETCMDVEDNSEVCLYGCNMFREIAEDGDHIYDFDVHWVAERLEVDRRGRHVRADVCTAACRALGAMGSSEDITTKGQHTLTPASNKLAHNYAHKLAFRLRNDGDGEVRLAACQGLGCMGKAAAAYVDAVASRLEGGEKTMMVREAACATLAAMGDVGEIYVELVAKLLNSEKPSVRKVACETLGKMGAAGASYADRIANLVEDSAPEVGECAKQTLIAMARQGSEAAAKKLSSDDPQCRIAAVKTLRLLKKEGLAHIDKIVNLIGTRSGAAVVPHGEDKDVLVEACLTLGAMSRVGAPRESVEAAAEFVAAMLDHVEAIVRVAACEALAAMRAAGAQYVDSVAARLGGSSFDLGWGVEATLEDADAAVRAAACKAIAAMGNEALVQSTNDLKKLIGSRSDDADLAVRKAAEEALRKIIDTEEELKNEQRKPSQ
jgi:hypothetical protein